MVSLLWNRALRNLLVVSLVSLIGVSAFAERQQTTFKKGDKVEVKDFDDWKEGVVVGTTRLGRVEVRVEESDLPTSVPKSIRERMMTKSYSADEIRPLAAAASSEPSADVRKWTDRSGKFSIAAEYAGMDGAKVVLKKADGSKVSVPVEKLSDADQAYLTERNTVSENPFGEPVAAEERDPADGKSVARKEPNWREVKQVRPKKFTKWSFAPASAGAGQSTASPGMSDVQTVLSQIPDSEKFFEDVESISVSQDGKRVIVCRSRGAVSNDKEQYIEVVDVASQKAGGSIPLPANTAVLDINPDASLLMFRSHESGFGGNNVLTISRIDGTQLSPVSQWEPYSREQWEPSRDIDSAWFMGADRVLTINGHGKALTVWDVPACKALLNIPVGSAIQLKTALSPDRTLLAVIMESGIAIIDLAAGQHVATVPGEGRHFTDVEFRADNKQLAGLSDDGVAVWDLATGKEVSSFYNAVMGRQPGLVWAGNYLLAQNRYLFDVQRRILLWEYQDAPGLGSESAFQSGTLFVVPKSSDDSDTVLVSSPLPHAAALEEAKSLPAPEELLAVRPGDSVAIEVDFDPSIAMPSEMRTALTERLQHGGPNDENGANVVVLKPADADSDLIRQALAAALNEAGLKVVESSNLVVKAVCKPQPQQTVRVNMDGPWPLRGGDIEERTITPHASYLEMTLNGESLWKRGFVARPHMVIWMNEGESLDQALERLTRPNLTLFSQARFNPYVARPGKATENGAYGVSQFTSTGLVDGATESGGSGVFE